MKYWEKLEEDISVDDDIPPWCSADMIHRWVQSREGYGVYCERIIPLLITEQKLKHCAFARHFRSNWDLVPGKYLLNHYDEKWFWELVTRSLAKMCTKIGIEPTTFACYHKNHINKCMAVAGTPFMLEDSIENGGDAMKLGFVCSHHYKISDRLVTSNTKTNADISRKVVREKNDQWLVDCSVTESSLGTPDNPKFPLKECFRKTILPIVDELVLPGVKYSGYTPIFQGDNAGTHEEDQYLTFVR